MSDTSVPAYPVDPAVMYDAHNGGSWEMSSMGLTKRERIAMSAPDAPDWFSVDCEPFVSPLTEEEKWEMACTKGKKAFEDYQKNLNIKKFFAWRAFYADALLAELAKE